MKTINAEKLSSNIYDYFTNQIEALSINNPIIKLSKPILNNLLKNNISKLDKYLNMIAKEDGTIDIEEILDDMFKTINDPNRFDISVPILGDIKIGNSTVELNIPYVNKGLILDSDDLQLLKESLITS